MAETSNRDDWRRKHSLLALWQDAATLRLRDTSLLSIAVDDDRPDEDRASLHRMARFCREEHAARDDVAEASMSPQPELGSGPVEAISEPEPSGEVAHPHPGHGFVAPAFSHSDLGSDRAADPNPLADFAFSPWQPAHGSATHPEPSVPTSEIDEISESLREVRNELKLLRERRTRRYF